MRRRRHAGSSFTPYEAYRALREHCGGGCAASSDAAMLGRQVSEGIDPRGVLSWSTHSSTPRGSREREGTRCAAAWGEPARQEALRPQQST